ncbi:MAG: hypothetical protein ACLQU1_22565 [Bryobacteraceae bacterium]
MSASDLLLSFAGRQLDRSFRPRCGNMQQHFEHQEPQPAVGSTCGARSNPARPRVSVVTGWLCLTIVLAGNGFAQSAQPSKPVSVPPIEDRELYYSFFNYQQGQVTSMQAAIAANPQSSTQLNQQMAALLGVAVTELPTVINNLKTVTQSYTALAAQRQAYVPPASPVSGQPTASQMTAEFELQRLYITLGGVSSLYLGLSSASWSGLHSYIVGPYKTTIYQP